MPRLAGKRGGRESDLFPIARRKVVGQTGSVAIDRYVMAIEAAVGESNPGMVVGSEPKPSQRRQRG